MKVTTNNKEAVFFREIDTGTFFFYEGNLFLKVNDNDVLNAYCFEDEEFEDFYKTDTVIPIPTDRISINVDTD
jgi:hypothetical protein